MAEQPHGPATGWVPCPTTKCAPEWTKQNCMSCPEVIQTCPTCNGAGRIPKAREATPCHPFDERCDYGTGGPCRNHGGIVPDRRWTLAAAIADAAGDGAFDDLRDTDREMWDAKEEDRGYWLRLADAALAVSVDPS